jgi:signal transduction histidine kinase
MERLRTRIATDLHDDVGSTVAQISILSAMAGRSASQGQAESLSEIASLSRELAGSMRDIVWAIDPEQDRLGDLVYRMRRFSSDLLKENGIRFDFQAPEAGDDLRMGTETRRQVFLLFKEGLHNMVRHSSCTEARIDLRLEAGWLVMSLHDDGKGFDASQYHEGHGLRSMRERARRLAGELVVDSSPGRGTTILVRVPLSRRRPRAASSPHERIGALGALHRMLKRNGNLGRHQGGHHRRPVSHSRGTAGSD